MVVQPRPVRLYRLCRWKHRDCGR